jgi:hypothetical protein
MGEIVTKYYLFILVYPCIAVYPLCRTILFCIFVLVLKTFWLGDLLPPELKALRAHDSI